MGWSLASRRSRRVARARSAGVRHRAGEGRVPEQGRPNSLPCFMAYAPHLAHRVKGGRRVSTCPSPSCSFPSSPRASWPCSCRAAPASAAPGAAESGGGVGGGSALSRGRLARSPPPPTPSRRGSLASPPRSSSSCCSQEAGAPVAAAMRRATSADRRSSELPRSAPDGPPPTSLGAGSASLFSSQAWLWPRRGDLLSSRSLPWASAGPNTAGLSPRLPEAAQAASAARPNAKAGCPDWLAGLTSGNSCEQLLANKAFALARDTCEGRQTLLHSPRIVSSVCAALLHCLHL